MEGVCRVCPICILLIGLLQLSQSSSTPRTTFLTGNPGRVLSRFTTEKGLNATTLLLSPDTDTLFVGARDAVLSLDVSQQDDITLKNKFDWAPPNNLSRCSPSDKNCANFIRVLQFINDTHLYACGSYAFQPHDTILTADKLTVIIKPKAAKGLCPYSGTERNTALFVDGELYAATTKDYWGKSPVISRYFSKGKQNLVLEDLPKLLSDPTFISSSYIPSEGKVLFFFRENAAEYNFVNRFTVSRVAQVCTNDNGGKLILQKRWTSFAKSLLICQRENELPFNLLQDIIMVPPTDVESPENTLFYGVFTSQWALASGQSAVCAFTLGDIKAAFSGNYRTFNMQTDHWDNQPNTDGKISKCGSHEESDETLQLVKKSFLTANSVNPAEQKQLLLSSEQLYSRITAQTVQDGSGRNYTILYLLSESGYLHKVVLLKNGSHIIEQIQVFREPQIMKSLLLSVTKGEVFVGFSKGVIRVPVHNCSFYRSCEECVLAQDPFCGWDVPNSVCALVSDEKPDLRQDVEKGNVKEQCENLQSDHKPIIYEKATVYPYQFVRLTCHSSFMLTKVYWTFSNHSVLPTSLYLQQKDGSLVFFTTPNTAVELHCVSEEQGFQQTAVIFSLSLQASPRAISSQVQHEYELNKLSHEPDLSHFLSGALLNEDNPASQQKNYYKEMVTVSFLLAICVCVGVLFSVLSWRRSLGKAGSEEKVL